MFFILLYITNDLCVARAIIVTFKSFAYSRPILVIPDLDNKIGIPMSNPKRLKEDKCLILAPPMKRIVTPMIPIIIAVL